MAKDTIYLHGTVSASLRLWNWHKIYIVNPAESDSTGITDALVYTYFAAVS